MPRHIGEGRHYGAKAGPLPPNAVCPPAGERAIKGGRLFALLLAMALLSIPGTARADRSRVYVGIGIGTAAAVGGGIVSWNISYSRQVKKQEPLREPSRSIAGLKFEKESLSASPIPSRFGPAPSLWFELPLLQLQW